MTIRSLKLYHYTSGSSLLNILDSSSLWATSIHHMADASEFIHCFDLVKSQLYAQKSKTSDENLQSICDVLVERLERLSHLAIYVACFSEIDDSISQWRGYCPPSFGYSVGFNSNKLEILASSQGFTLRQCIYNPQQKVAMLNNWISEVLTFINTKRPTTVSIADFCERGIEEFLGRFATVASYMKDASFQDEREWRLVGLVPSDDPRVSVRSKKSMLIPYVPIQLHLSQNSKLLWNIRIGPTPHIELAMDTLSLYFRKVNIENGVGRTMIPYRDW